jgi:hypothetical protein
MKRDDRGGNGIFVLAQAFAPGKRSSQSKSIAPAANCADGNLPAGAQGALRYELIKIGGD